mmetsp:Transcript_62532/g.70759  ORF Transcript_62532/g.70759 Transcript_62532/m.70759 type:complete len:94 (+) Transcript_62532:107-388(+)
MMFSTNHTIKYDYPLDTTIPTGNTTGTTLTFMNKLCQQYSPSNIELKSSSLRIMNHAGRILFKAAFEAMAGRRQRGYSFQDLSKLLQRSMVGP